MKEISLRFKFLLYASLMVGKIKVLLTFLNNPFITTQYSSNIKMRWNLYKWDHVISRSNN